jgi:lipopolysaccharide export LptBFGC system permease protein LptF
MNQGRGAIWFSLGAPLLILLALLATNQRQGKDRVQVLPAVLVGSGLIISSALGRQRRRARLLADLQRARTPGSNP